MPALVDAHVHLGYRKGTTFTADNFTRENILDQLNQFAYWGVSGVLSTGTDIGDLIFQIRNATNAPDSKRHAHSNRVARHRAARMRVRFRRCAPRRSA